MEQFCRSRFGSYSLQASPHKPQNGASSILKAPKQQILYLLYKLLHWHRWLSTLCVSIPSLLPTPRIPPQNVPPARCSPSHTMFLPVPNLFTLVHLYLDTMKQTARMQRIRFEIVNFHGNREASMLMLAKATQTSDTHVGHLWVTTDPALCSWAPLLVLLDPTSSYYTWGMRKSP